jgi:hypothetical protein
MDPIRFETHPDRYRHFTQRIDGDTARLILKVDEDGGLREGYELKLNSYDLGVDIELADAIMPSPSRAAPTASTARARTSSCSESPSTASR